MPNVSEPDPNVGITPLGLLVLLAENLRLLVFGPVLFGLVALGYAFILTPVFTATTRLLPPQQQNSASALAAQLGAVAGLVGMGVNLKTPTDMYIGLIRSRSVSDRIIDRFDLLHVYDLKYRVDARKQLEESTTIKTGKDGLIMLEVDDTDAKRAAAIANAFAEELSAITSRLAVTEAQQRRAFFQGQIQQAQEGLKRAEASLRETGASEALIKSLPQTLVAGIAQLRAQVTAQEVRMSMMRGYLTETSPELRLAQLELMSLKAELSRVEHGRPSGNSQSSDYLNRYRDFKYQETLFELMVKQYEMARLDEAREGALIQVVDVALPPERKSKPVRSLIAILAALSAGFLLIIFVFLREAYRRARGDPHSAALLSRAASGIPYLGKERGISKE